MTQLRETILDILPDADQGISYGAPAFKVGGKTIAGFAAFKHHLSYLPHSGSVLVELSEELKGYATSSGALRFDIDKPLPRHLLKTLIDVRLRQASASGPFISRRVRMRPRDQGGEQRYRIFAVWEDRQLYARPRHATTQPTKPDAN